MVLSSPPMHRPARRAERGRLETIQAELITARADLEDKRRIVAEAEMALAAAAAAETQARTAWRDAQRATDTAREEHAAAEREISRNAARISALQEARARISSGLDEARTAAAEAAHALAALADPAELEARLAA